MALKPEILKQRTFYFALNTVRTVIGLKRSNVNDVMGKQVLRSPTYVGANYRAGWKAKSTADFSNKSKIVEEESDEPIYWLDPIKAYNNIADSNYEPLLKESKDLERIFYASAITVKSNKLKQTQS